MVEDCSSLTQKNPSFLWDMFQEKNNDYNLRSKNLLLLTQAKTTTYGNESLFSRQHLMEFPAKCSGGWWDFFLGGGNFPILGVVKTNFGSHTPKAFIT